MFRMQYYRKRIMTLIGNKPIQRKKNIIRIGALTALRRIIAHSKIMLHKANSPPPFNVSMKKKNSI